VHGRRGTRGGVGATYQAVDGGEGAASARPPSCDICSPAGGGGRRWRGRHSGDEEEKIMRDSPVGPSFRGTLDFSWRNLVFLELELDCVPNKTIAPKTPQ
jgi:hypothetical protein